jgi:hypothetical protein
LNTKGEQLKEDEAEGLTTPITEEEIWTIIKNNPKNKSPGTDGLTNEFYQEYWHQIKKYLLDSFNKGLDKGILNMSQRRGIISLIPKPQKDLEDLKNWRPITLLNHDYKLLTKAIANRIKKILPEIINDDQGGFVQNRYIGCNIQRIQNLIDICEEQKEDNILINIDFEKAFDTIEWDFIYQTLQHLNFPINFINWIKTIYNGIETCIINNGFTTKFFKPQKGVRQGCPLSPYIFILTVELMNRWIRKKISQHGTQDKKGNNYLILQFADDTSFAINNNAKAIHDLFEHLRKFGEASGLKININKTEILLLGNTLKENIPKNYKKYVKDSVKYLGCNIYKSHKKTTEMNIEEAVNKIKKLLEKWNRRYTTLSGKIAVIKSLLLPQLTYILSTMPSPPKEKIQEINKLFYKFLYSGGSEKIKRNILIGDYNTGGYRMTDLISYIKAIKIRWIDRLIQIPGLWKKNIENTCGIDIVYLSRCNIKFKDLPFKFAEDSMWNEIWREWCMENYKEPEGIEEILEQNLWYNSNILIQGKVQLWKRWEEAGIKWIADLISVNNDGSMEILPIGEMEECYDIKIKQMEYNSLISALPKSWKKLIRTEIYTGEEEDKESILLIDNIQKSSKPMKMIYKTLVEKKKELPERAILQWNTDLRKNLTSKEILSAHTANHGSVSNHKLKSFNCNFLNRNVPTNKYLKDLRKTEDDKCPFCGKIEDLKHLYWECEAKKPLWKHLRHLHQRVTKKILILRKEKCILGIDKNYSIKDQTTHRCLCLLVKHYIHLCKCDDDEKPTKKGMEIYLRQYINIERLCAERGKRLNKFYEIWGEWGDWCQLR